MELVTIAIQDSQHLRIMILTPKRRMFSRKSAEHAGQDPFRIVITLVRQLEQFLLVHEF